MNPRQKPPGDVCHDAFLAAVNDPTKSPAQCWEDVYKAAIAIPPPEPTPEEKIRAEFELHPQFKDENFKRLKCGGYASVITESAWQGWNAARGEGKQS